jgi:hypothetical protein
MGRQLYEFLLAGAMAHARWDHEVSMDIVRNRKRLLLLLAIAFLCGSAVGTVIGGTINNALYDADPLLSELFISVMYTVLLGFLGFYATLDHWRAKSDKEGATEIPRDLCPTCTRTAYAESLTGES